MRRCSIVVFYCAPVVVFLLRLTDNTKNSRGNHSVRHPLREAVVCWWGPVVGLVVMGNLCFG